MPRSLILAVAGEAVGAHRNNFRFFYTNELGGNRTEIKLNLIHVCREDWEEAGKKLAEIIEGGLLT